MTISYLGWLLLSPLLISCGAAMASGPPDSSIAGTANPPGGDTKTTCETAGAKWFKEKYPEPEEHYSVASGKATYTTHLSSAKGGCFLEAIETAHFPEDSGTEIVDSEIHHLIDLKTGQQIGQFVMLSNFSAPLWCEVGNAECLNITGWNALADAYMKR